MRPCDGVGMTETALLTRAALPDALRVLVEEIPRETWEAHPHFGGMVRFWLERHAMFREVMGRLRAETEGVIDRRTAPEAYAPRLSRLGGFFLGELHMHHNVEDHHYFPRLVGLDARVGKAFDILDADHKALDGLLNGFEGGANTVLRAEGEALRGAAGAFHDDLDRLAGFLERHLTDEEEIVVPVILKSGFDG